jgi:hypothetical protein
MRVLTLCLVLLVVGAAPAFTQENSGMAAEAPCTPPENFVADERYQQIAEAYALDAVDGAQANFGVPLDWTDASIARVEDMLGEMHRQIGPARPSRETIENFGKIFGSYIGEVYRRNHGATWGLITISGQTFPGLMSTQTCTLFWPWRRVQNRLVDGDENNVLHYYQALLEGPGE